VSLKNHIERELGLPVKVRAGAPGALDVFVNGEKIYSKRETGRFPAGDELIQLIRPKIPAVK
jgi:selT/selW/selH-like putative selenoprotein